MSPDTWWTMGNQLAYDAENDAYVVSLRVTHTVVSWSRQAEEITWILGSDSPSLASDTLFSGQHGLQVLDSGNLLVFDNGTNESASRVLEFEIDESGGTAEVAWQYDPETTLYSYVLGDAVRLDNGNTIVIFGTEKTIQEVTQDKEVVWEMTFADTTLIGFAQYHEQVVHEPTP